MKQSRRLLVSTLILVPFLFTVIVYLVYREDRTKRPDQLAVTTAGYVEMCLNCHDWERPDGAHDRKVVGCSPCHLGDPLAIDKEKAHAGMVLNPGDLRVVERTCGVEGCHPADVAKVKNSLMATNRGILATLLYYWGERDNQYADITVEQLIKSGETSLALDYFRKLCATCHLWKQKNDMPGAPAFFNEKGGGCSACHFVLPKGEKRLTVTSFDRDETVAAAGDGNEQKKEKKKKPHPLIIKKIPEDNCIRCHNRSGRIGISYTGIFESEGYGTPYEKGHLSSKRLPGDRFYLEIAEDIHHKKGMACIDCHTRDEVMGDGTRYAHYEEQLEIGCTICHTSDPGTTRKGKKLTNLVRDNGQILLVGRNNGKKYPLKPPRRETCLYPGHKRLSCESCHSTWVPQCYGCHAKRDAGETHLDKLTLKETPGWWEEGRSYIRYEKPMLGVWQDEVVIVTPGCQDIVTLIDSKGTVESSFKRLTMAAINPHTTQAAGRSCADCHASPKTLGLGEGTVMKKDGKWGFVPANQGVETLDGQTVGLDNFVRIDGTPLQHTSRADLRPFNGEELQRILRVGLCLRCHPKITDPAYRDYSPATICPSYREP